MQLAPHFYLTVDCELDALMALREQLNTSAGKTKDGKPLFKLSVNDFSQGSEVGTRIGLGFYF